MAMKHVWRVALIVLVLGSARPLHAQPQAVPSLEIGGQAVVARIGELDVVDVGVGGRAAWFPTRSVGIEGELNLFPRDVPSGSAITGSRFEGLFGLTAGPRLGVWRPFGRARAGFLRVESAPGPTACILIFPPPVACGLAAGETLLTADLGGGVELFTPRQTFVRIDVGDRLLRYPGPAIDRGGAVHEDAFIHHNLRVGVGAGWRF